MFVEDTKSHYAFILETFLKKAVLVTLLASRGVILAFTSFRVVLLAETFRGELSLASFSFKVENRMALSGWLKAHT